MRITFEQLHRLSELAISEGQQLLNQSSRLVDEAPSFPLRIDPREEFMQEWAEGFFGEVQINGQSRSAMGCHHRVLIAPGAGPDCADTLRDLAFRSLLQEAATTDKGQRGGFTVRRLLPQPEGGEVDGGLAVDWRTLDDIVPWATVSIELHDFELRLGPVKLKPRQIVFVVQHPAFTSDQSQPSSDIVHRIVVGYPFVQYAPLRNPFGFGPGKFGAAIKLFTFSLRTDRSLEIKMIFVAAPRCAKVIDVLGLPDPVFGLFELIETITLGSVRAEPRRNRLEALMLETHCRVHSAFLAGFVRRWRKSH